ncbi:MAG: CDP-alcohol phosphatidyltransferase family protein [Crocinitomicaceae bacterium]|nr:CDP-alcohol phosphatidyltransferase family protein [Crocinitomicaceae bacterium]
MFTLANLFTSANLISGIIAVILAVMGRLDLAAYAIFSGAVFDFLDGFIARITKTTGELGKQLDSLADMITFGVAPGVVMMVVLTIDIESIGFISPHFIKNGFDLWFEGLFDGRLSLIPFAGLIIPFFSLFRLAKFNIDIRQSESFIGVPTPANTLLFMTFPLVLNSIQDVTSVHEVLFSPYLLVLLMIVMGLLMVSEIPLFSLKFKRFSFKGNEIRFTFLLISLIFILVFKVWSIALIVFLYLIFSIVENTFFKKEVR